MIRQRVDIHECDWSVVVFYDTRPQDAYSILNALCHMGCADKHLYKAERLLRSGVPNEGLAYSNPHTRESIIVIGHVSDFFEFADTISHEKQHLEQAICRADGLDPYGEDIAYISGAISQAIARNAWMTARKMFLYLI